MDVYYTKSCAYCKKCHPHTFGDEVIFICEEGRQVKVPIEETCPDQVGKNTKWYDTC